MTATRREEALVLPPVQFVMFCCASDGPRIPSLGGGDARFFPAGGAAILGNRRRPKQDAFSRWDSSTRRSTGLRLSHRATVRLYRLSGRAMHRISYLSTLLLQLGSMAEHRDGMDIDTAELLASYQIRRMSVKGCPDPMDQS